MVKKGPRRVAVIGGGIAGLACAWSLARAGVPVEVFESRPHLGGRCEQTQWTTLEWQGHTQRFPCEHGVHGVWRGYTHLNAIIESLGTSQNLVSTAHQGFLFRREDGSAGALEIGQSVRRSLLPSAMAPLAMLGSREVLRNPNLFFGSLKAVPGPLRQLIGFNPNTPESLGALDSSAFVKGWPPLFQKLMATLCRSAFFTEPDKVALGAFLNGLWTYGIAEKNNSQFRLFENGIYQDLISPLAQDVRKAGGEIHTGWRCTGLKVGANGVQGVNLIGDDGRRKQYKASAVVLALDPPALGRIAKGPLKKYLSAYSCPHGLESLVVRLWYAGTPSQDRPWTGLLGHGAADAYFWLHRFFKPAVAWQRRTGGGCIELHCYGKNVEDLRTLSRDHVIRELDHLVGWAWPEVGPCIHGHVSLNPATHPHFSPENFGRLPPVRLGIPGLSLCGDWVQSPQPSLFMERSALTALMAARAATERLELPLDELPPIIPPPPTGQSLKFLSQLSRIAGLGG